MLPSVSALFLAPRDPAAAPRPAVLVLNFTLVLALLALGFTFTFQQLQYRWNWDAPWRYRTVFAQGWITTLLIASAALILSTLVAVGTALLGRSRLLAARALVRVYTELARGTPLLVQILLLFYVIAPAIQLTHRLTVGILALSFFTGAYLAEIVRAGIDGVARTQWESAKAIGLTRPQIYRLVVLPQALRQILPPLAGQFVSLVKDSSLLSVIGIGEFTQQAQQVNSLTYSTLESYLPLAVGYLILTLPLSIWSRHLERRSHFDT